MTTITALCWLASSRWLPTCVNYKKQKHTENPKILFHEQVFSTFLSFPVGVYVCREGATCVVVVFLSLRVRAKALSCQSKICNAASGTFYTHRLPTVAPGTFDALKVANVS